MRTIRRPAPAGERTAANRERLVTAAAELFYRRGFEATPVEDILAATGVSRSNFYYHFADKHELARAVVERWIETYDREIVTPSLTAEGMPAGQRLQGLFARAARFQEPEARRTGCPLGRLALELAEQDPAVRRRIGGYFDVLRSRIAAVLGRPGAPGGPEAGRLAELAVCVLEGALLLSHVHQDPGHVHRAGKTLAALLA